jgi:hypothetical protein
MLLHGRCGLNLRFYPLCDRFAGQHRAQSAALAPCSGIDIDKTIQRGEMEYS